MTEQGVILSPEQKMKVVGKYHKKAVNSAITELDDETIFTVFCNGNRVVKDKTNRNRREFLCIIAISL